jgi:aspartate/methionine/tyrosine aminotransferase
MTRSEGFALPPYPYDALAQLYELAQKHAGGAVDLSIGTPCDPPPDKVVDALASSHAERGYPASVGSPALREAASRWMMRRFGVSVDPACVAACVGTKEFVASLAWYLRLREPKRDTVLHPLIAYPTYQMSAELAGLRAVGVPEAAGGGLDLGAIAPTDADRALVLWVNSPANPTGTLSDLNAAAAWGRARGVPVASDECYCEFTWREAPSTILSSGSDGVIALHSLSKRSNLAGCRVGFFAGDPDIVGFLAEVRRHAGLMVPGPVQHAGAVALDDDEHVERQRGVYLRRLERLAEVLGSSGSSCSVPDGAFYLWVPVPDWAVPDAGDGEAGALDPRTTASGSLHSGERAHDEVSGSWILARALAEEAGVVVSPGTLYGETPGDGSREHVRIAVVQPDERIELVASRLAASDHPRIGQASHGAVRTSGRPDVGP